MSYFYCSVSNAADDVDDDDHDDDNDDVAGVYDGLAIDTGRHKLYLADAAQSGGKVAEISTDGTGYRVLFSSNSSNSSQPRALVLHNDNRCLSSFIISNFHSCFFLNRGMGYLFWETRSSCNSHW